MTLEHAQPRKQKRYLRKTDLLGRYGWKTTISVDRAWQKYHTLPPPTIYQGKFPMWDEAILDEHDSRARKSSVVVSPERKEAIKQNLDHARRVYRDRRRGRASA
jgi:hypothetical protein